MKGLDFPYAKTKSSSGLKFNLDDKAERKKYFKHKAGKEIKKLREYLNENTFVAYMLAKKAAGKGTYSKLFKEAMELENVVHISVGDIVRKTDSIKSDPKKLAEFKDYMMENYRGFMSLDEAMDAFLNRSTSKLLPTEFILALVKRKIDEAGKSTLFIDGFPRNLDQVSYSLYFRELINYRNDPDLFILIDLPNQVIDERMKYRVVCPKCQTPRNLKLLATPYVGYDEDQKQYYLMCDNPECEKARMIDKEGDSQGIEAIRDRLEMDEDLIKRVFDLHGVPKVFLRNAIPVNVAEDIVDDYEITQSYEYENKNGKIEVAQKNWIVKDDNGIDSYSLLAAPVAVSLIRQLVEVLGL